MVYAFSSDVYLIKAKDLKELPTEILTDMPKTSDYIVMYMDSSLKYNIVLGEDIINSVSEDTFLPVRIMYQSFPKLKSFFINLLKKIKRKHYIVARQVFTVLLSNLYDNHVLRGERTAANAYQWSNKKWQMTEEEKRKRWDDLYNSIKTNGFDEKTPILLVLNRNLGVKDQLFQGHHRLGICKELNIKEVKVSFWAVHRSFSFLKIFVRKKV